VRSWGGEHRRPPSGCGRAEKECKGTGLARVAVRVVAGVRRAQAQEDEGWGDLEEASEVQGENPRVGSRRREDRETSPGEEESEG